jgi:hypothetical protein
LRIDAEGGSGNGVAADLLHAGVDHLPKIKFGILLLDIGLKLLICNLVAFLVLAILGQILLDGIVGKVNRARTDFEGVLGTGGAHVTFPVPVPLHSPVHAVHHHVVAQIEFPLSIKQRSFDVLLQDVGFESAVVVLFLPF